MGLLSQLSIPYAKWMAKQNKKWIDNPIHFQEKTFKYLLNKAKNTSFGKEHDFKNIASYEDFKKMVPVRDYEGLKKYIFKMLDGQENVLWPKKPMYFSKTSGTTSGSKYIPISKESMPYHLKGAKDALLSYIAESGDSSFVSGKTIFIQGSPSLDFSKGVPIGRLSGIVAHHLPFYLKSNNLPSFKTNCLEDWEEKINTIVEETVGQNMSLISGIPPWVQMYLEKIHQKTGKNIKQVFPNFNLFVYGGVNYKPYKKRFLELIGQEINSVETYPASEGFIAYQDSQSQESLLLCVNHGIFYEFIESAHFFDKSPNRISLKDVRIGVDYVVILNTNAGLWGYNIGDTVRFVSTKPYRLVVSGRIKHFTSAFGEHVISKEVEKALFEATKKQEVVVQEFHVAPQVNPPSGLPYHEWFIEFEVAPKNETEFAKDLDAQLQLQNSYYKDLIQGKVLRPLVIRKVKKGGFYNYMKSVGKLGGQNKPPRLANNRKLADQLIPYIDA